MRLLLGAFSLFFAFFRRGIYCGIFQIINRFSRIRWISDYGGLGLTTQYVIGNNNPLDLGSSFEYLHDLGVPHHLFHRIFAGVAIAAQDLDRIGGNLHAYVTGETLGKG